MPWRPIICKSDTQYGPCNTAGKAVRSTWIILPCLHVAKGGALLLDDLIPCMQVARKQLKSILASERWACHLDGKGC